MPDTISSTSPNNNNVTLAILAQKIDNTNAMLTEVKSELKGQREASESRLRAVENWQSSAEVKITNVTGCVDEVEKKVDDLAQKTTWWNGANSALSFIAAIVGSMLGPRQ